MLIALTMCDGEVFFCTLCERVHEERRCPHEEREKALAEMLFIPQMQEA